MDEGVGYAARVRTMVKARSDPLSPGVDVIGPITRAMADAFLILNAMMGPDPANDPQTLASPVTEALSITPRRTAKPLAGLTIGVPQTDWMTTSTTAPPQTQCSAETLAAFDALRAKLQDLGAVPTVRSTPAAVRSAFVPSARSPGTDSAAPGDRPTPSRPSPPPR